MAHVWQVCDARGWTSYSDRSHGQNQRLVDYVAAGWRDLLPDEAAHQRYWKQELVAGAEASLGRLECRHCQDWRVKIRLVEIVDHVGSLPELLLQ